MKKNLLYSILVGAAVASLASCDVNSWNDKLDGFDGEQSIVDAQAIEYTLTDADYANLAANSDSTISLTKFRQRSMFPIS